MFTSQEKATPDNRRGYRAIAGGALIIGVVLLSACQGPNPPVPTAIPTVTITPKPSLTPSPSPTRGPTATPPAPIQPVVTATSAVTAPPAAVLPSATPTPGPVQIVAKNGDTITSLLLRGGYTDYSVLAEFKRLNGMCDSCTNIEPGRTYLIPRQTPTPTPSGYGETQVAQQTQGVGVLGTVTSTTTYTIVAGDTLFSVLSKTGVSLSVLCDLNHPERLNCGGCDLTKSYAPGCRPLMVVGTKLLIPGPTPTPSTTPTLTGSETATPTAAYLAPAIVAPVMDTSVSGPVQLLWVTVGILQPGEFYLVQVTDRDAPGGARSLQFEVAATSLSLRPEDFGLTGAGPHTIYWQVGVARKSPDGVYVSVGPMTVIYSFQWVVH